MVRNIERVCVFYGGKKNISNKVWINEGRSISKYNNNSNSY